MKAVVVDASALVEYLLCNAAAKPVRTVLADLDVDVRVPALCDVEIVSALRRAVLRKRISVDRAAAVLEDLGDVPVTRHGHESLLGRVLALRDNFSAYDAIYVALAERLGATLVTADRVLATAVRAHLNLQVITLETNP